MQYLVYGFLEFRAGYFGELDDHIRFQSCDRLLSLHGLRSRNRRICSEHSERKMRPR